MKSPLSRAPSQVVFMLACLVATTAQATFLAGTVPIAPGQSLSPGLVVASPGTLLASLSAPFVISTGASSGTLLTAVYRNSSGTLDFYYQITNNLTSTNCGTAGNPACDALTRETDITFTGFLTAVGYRTDGASLVGPSFVNGTVVPSSADRNSGGNVMGFQFGPPDPAKIPPGSSSFVLVISTDATTFAAGNSSVSDGGSTTTSAFQPAAAPTPTGTPPTSTPTGTPTGTATPTNTPTATATPLPSQTSVVPTLSFPMLGLLALALIAVGLFVTRRL